MKRQAAILEEPTYYAQSGNRERIKESEIVRIIADSGWYEYKTNLDILPYLDKSRRMRWAIVKGHADPVFLFESFGMQTPGGSISLNGGGYTPAKDKTPFLGHHRWYTRSTYILKDNFFSVMDKPNAQYLHPRFTSIKKVIKAYDKVLETRGKIYRKACAEIDKQTPFVYEEGDS